MKELQETHFSYSWDWTSIVHRLPGAKSVITQERQAKIGLDVRNGLDVGNETVERVRGGKDEAFD